MKSQLSFKPYSINKLSRILTSQPIRGRMPRLDLPLYLCLYLCLQFHLCMLITRQHRSEMPVTYTIDGWCLFEISLRNWMSYGKICEPHSNAAESQRVRLNKELTSSRTRLQVGGNEGNNHNSCSLSTEEICKNTRSSKTKAMREWLTLVQAFFLFAPNAPSTEWMMVYTCAQSRWCKKVFWEIFLSHLIFFSKLLILTE